MRRLPPRLASPAVPPWSTDSASGHTRRYPLDDRGFKPERGYRRVELARSGPSTILHDDLPWNWRAAPTGVTSDSTRVLPRAAAQSSPANRSSGSRFRIPRRLELSSTTKKHRIASLARVSFVSAGYGVAQALDDYRRPCPAQRAPSATSPSTGKRRASRTLASFGPDRPCLEVRKEHRIVRGSGDHEREP